MNDSPQLFDPDAFAEPSDPVEVHDLDIDASAGENGDEDEPTEPLLEEPFPDPEADPDELVSAGADAYAYADADADAEEAEVEAEPVSQSVLDTVLSPDTVVEKISVGAPPTLRAVAGGRHEARERAAHLLYEVQMKDRPVEDVLDDQVLAPDPYAADLVRGVERHRDELDEVIGRLARGWSLQRMPKMDLVVLRVGVYELAHRADVPRGVILSEAVDLAGQYGTDDSSKFVNGLLAAAANELRPSN